jgi:hypothetical protein
MYDGKLIVGSGDASFSIQFSKGDDKRMHFYKTNDLRRIARIKDVGPGERISPENYDSSSNVYTIQIGELFLAENLQGDILIGRIIKIADDSRGADRDEVRFDYDVFRAGETITAS